MYIYNTKRINYQQLYLYKYGGVQVLRKHFHSFFILEENKIANSPPLSDKNLLKFCQLDIEFFKYQEILIRVLFDYEKYFIVQILERYVVKNSVASKGYIFLILFSQHLNKTPRF